MNYCGGQATGMRKVENGVYYEVVTLRKDIIVTVQIIIYSGSYCPYCVRAKELLKRKGVSFTEVLVDEDDAKRDEMIAKTGRYTIPQIFINEKHVGGCDDLYALERAGELNGLLGL
jgi:glutaredoxin 3